MVVINGASAGVGRAAAQAFARRGARLGVLARGREGLAATVREARQLGAPAVASARVDAADPDAVEAAADGFEDELGPITVWVNALMTSVFAPVHEITAEEHRRVLEVNYLGVVHGTLAALRRMRPRDHGTIVQVGSALSFRGIPLQSAYCASKHALQGFHESLLGELRHAGSNVRTTLVHLPALNTPQFTWVRTRLPNHPQPVPPIYDPGVAARAIVHAAEHTPRQMLVGPATVATRYANVVAPALLDRRLAATGWDDQQTDTPIDHERWTDNLFAPADEDEDHGPRGPFGAESRSRSLQLWAAMHKRAVAGGVLGVLGLAAAALRRR